MHERDLAGRSAEAEPADLRPDTSRLTERDVFGGPWRWRSIRHRATGRKCAAFGIGCALSSILARAATSAPVASVESVTKYGSAGLCPEMRLLTTSVLVLSAAGPVPCAHRTGFDRAMKARQRAKNNRFSVKVRCATPRLFGMIRRGVAPERRRAGVRIDAAATGLRRSPSGLASDDSGTRRNALFPNQEIVMRTTQTLVLLTCAAMMLPSLAGAQKTAEQQKNDEAQCNTQAVQQSGYDRNPARDGGRATRARDGQRDARPRYRGWRAAVGAIGGNDVGNAATRAAVVEPRDRAAARREPDRRRADGGPARRPAERAESLPARARLSVNWFRREGRAEKG